MIIISGFIGGFSGVMGTLLSTIMEGMATGPLIIVAATIMFIISLVFSPKRGLLAKAIKLLSLRKRTAVEQIFLSLYDVAEGGNLGDITEDEILIKRKVSSSLFQYAISVLEKKEYISRAKTGKWMLTDKGIEAGFELVLQQRLYEMYLMHEMEFAHLELKTREDLHLASISNETKDQLLRLLRIHDRVPLLLPESAISDRRMMINDL